MIWDNDVIYYNEYSKEILKKYFLHGISSDLDSNLITLITFIK